MHYPVKVHLKLDQSRICIPHDYIITVLTAIINEFKIMIVISKTESGFVDLFADGVQLSREHPEILKRSEGRIQPRPGNVTLAQCMCPFYTLVNIFRHGVCRLIEQLREIVVAAGGYHFILLEKLFERRGF